MKSECERLQLERANYHRQCNELTAVESSLTDDMVELKSEYTKLDYEYKTLCGMF